MAGKADIVNHVANAVNGVTKAQAGAVVDPLFDFITGALADGDRVLVPGFGTFMVSERAARKGRNPRTGEEIEIAASTVPRFRAGKALKEAVNS